MKIKLNKINMLKNGIIAVITLLGTGLLFGVENIMIAFPIALTSTVLGRQNIWGKATSKTLMLIISYIIIYKKYKLCIKMLKT